VTSSKVINGQDYSIAGKTFEYISMRKPIVGFVCDGAQKRLLEKTGLSLICDPDTPGPSAGKLESLIDTQVEFSPNRKFLTSLHRRLLTKKLADTVWNAAVTRRSAVT